MPRNGSNVHKTTGNAAQNNKSNEQVRLSLNVNSEVADTLKGYADREGVSVTEAVRRAVSVFRYVDETQQRGASMAVKNADNSLVEVRFL